MASPVAACATTGRRMKRSALLFLVLLVPALAHHSVSAEFDASKPVTLKGNVTKLEWMNPHAWLYIDVKNDKGEVEHWQLEFGAPNGLVRQGWRRTDLKEGAEVTVEGILAKKTPFTANARSITLPGGKRVFSGQADRGDQ